MSQKITAKNLTYDKSLPPFLARLRGQHVADSSSPDPLLASRRRHGRVRSASEEAEDAPVVVDEQGNVVQSKDGAIDEDGDLRGTEEERPGKEDPDKESIEKQNPDKAATIGAGKKRKLGKVVGGGDEDDAPSKDGARAGKTGKDALKRDGQNGGKKDARSTEKPKKKAKKIKLSFGDDGD